MVNYLKKCRKEDHIHYRVLCKCAEVVQDCGHGVGMTHVLAPCYHSMTATELFDHIVEQHASFNPPEPIWFGFAITSISKQWRKPVDAVFEDMKSAIHDKSPAAAALLP